MDSQSVPTDSELVAFLDESLSVERSAAVERLVRERPELRQRMALLARWRDQGGHSLGEVWRRNRLSCLTRTQLGSYLLGVTPPELADYIKFHLEQIGCRYCQANLEDLQNANAGASTDQQQRRRRYFESSAGLLRSRRRNPDE